MLAAHITLAFVSLLLGTYTAFVPSLQKLRLIYGFTVGTVISGSVLAIMQPVNLGKACVSGIVYLGCVITLTFIARRKLAAKAALY